jgi:hypothetical protein
MKRGTCLAFLVGVLHAATATAHDLGASQAFLIEEPAGHYTLGAIAPSDYAYLFAPPRLPPRCGTVETLQGDGEVRFLFDCARPLSADDTLVLAWQREGIVLKAAWANGETVSRFFVARGGAITVDLASLQAGSGSFADAARRYTLLGVEHILFGIDHLLFVVGLLLIVRGPWMLLKTITAFTLAHSLTLGLATLGIVEVPPAPVEACIALSIVLVAAEGLRRGRQGTLPHRPWLIAFVFGLLHGFGFAGALSALGLPAGEIPTALLFFNVGVEIGQIAFVTILLGIHYLMGRWIVALPRWTEAIPGYAIGCMAMLWFFERVAVIVG